MVWTHPPQLVRFAQVLERARNDASSVSDRELVDQVRATYWGTNCWSWVEMSLAIISSACALRPHLAEELIADPIGVMIEGGLDKEDDVIAQGVALARKERPYVPLSEDGRAWLLQDWPLLEAKAKMIFQTKWIELNEQLLRPNIPLRVKAPTTRERGCSQRRLTR
jgi:hypothetical protein